MGRQEAVRMSRARWYPTLEEMLEVLGDGAMTSGQIADALPGSSADYVYRTLCEAKARRQVRIEWLDRYSPAWRRCA